MCERERGKGGREGDRIVRERMRGEIDREGGRKAGREGETRRAQEREEERERKRESSERKKKYLYSHLYRYHRLSPHHTLYQVVHQWPQHMPSSVGTEMGRSGEGVMRSKTKVEEYN